MFNFKYFYLFLFVLVLGFGSLAYALPPSGNLTNVCFTDVVCDNYGDATLTDFNQVEYCTITNIHTPEEYKSVFIEIVQGGHYDSSRNHELIITPDSPYLASNYSFFVNGAVNPTYVLCHEAQKDVNGGYVKGITLDAWVTGNIDSSNQKVENSFDITAIETKDIYLDPEENNIIFFIGILLIVLGSFFGIVDTVNISRRW